MGYIKILQEKRAEAQQKLQDIISKAEKEQRSATKEELAEFEKIEKEIEEIDKTIEAEERARKLDIKKNTREKTEETEERAQKETNAFADYIRGTLSEEKRADVNMTTTDNGAVIPNTIINKIIDKVKEICPIFLLATKYDIGGTISIPYVSSESKSEITMAYATEFSDLESKSEKLSSIQLTGYLAGALSKISKSLLNNSNFDLVNFVVKKMAEAISAFVEKELLIGTDDKITGLRSVTQSKTTVNATKLTADELIELQDMIPDVYQADARWIMNKTTRTAIRKLKDGQGNYLLQKDFSEDKTGRYTLLGKPVHISDNMPALAAGATTIFYGDFSGLAVKISENPTIEILREKYATQHAIGVVAWLEMDSKVENAQKIAKLTMASTAIGD